jgi:thioredoxin reductase (NADPH)
MTELDPETAPLIVASRPDHVFPMLTAAQVARVAAHGRARRVEGGEVLVNIGDRVERFFLVTSGRIDVVRESGANEELVVIHRSSQFTGDVSMLSGRHSLMRLRAAEPGEVIELDRPQLMALVQTDAELGEIFMRAFILRRVELIAHGFGDVVLAG